MMQTSSLILIVPNDKALCFGGTSGLSHIPHLSPKAVPGAYSPLLALSSQALHHVTSIIHILHSEANATIWTDGS